MVLINKIIFLVILIRVIKSGVQAALDPDLEFKDYAVRNYNEEQRKLQEKYGNLASGAYDDDNIVKAASFATFMVDPFYLFAYLSPWGRAATATYKGLAAVSGGTVGLDVLMNQLATTGEVNPKEVAGTAAAASVLGPLSVKALEHYLNTFPGAKRTTCSSYKSYRRTKSKTNRCKSTRI